MTSRADLVDAVLETPVGETVNVVIFRNGRHYHAPVEVEERPGAAGARGVL